MIYDIFLILIRFTIKDFILGYPIAGEYGHRQNNKKFIK